MHPARAAVPDHAPTRRAGKRVLALQVDSAAMGEVFCDALEQARRQAFLEGRIMTVETMLKSAVLIASNGPSDTVILGSRVTVVEEGFEPETYTIVGSAEANPADGRISHESPVGKALMGHREGDRIAFRAPGGLIEMKLLHIE